MPVYEYRCKSCQIEFEQRVSMSTPVTDITCPDCGQQDSERIMSVFFGKATETRSAQAPSPCAACPSAIQGGCGVPGGHQH